MDGAWRLAPGDPADSNALQRIKTRGYGQMPPLATTITDPLGVSLLERWIESLEGCP